MVSNDYEFYRKFDDEAAINCYTGCFCYLLQNEGVQINEEDILLIGKGFSFRSGLDEYSKPLLSFDLFETVKRFNLWFGCKMEKHSFNKNNDIILLTSLLEKKNVLVWVNSKYLKYSDLYYSQKGYLHAIILKDVYGEFVRVKDRLIVSTPTVSCETDLSLDNLQRALHDIVTIPEGNFMGEYITLDIKSRINAISEELLRKKLLEVANTNLNQYNLKISSHSAIYDYFLLCRNYLIEGGEKRKEMLQRMNTNIRTLYCIPNRKLIYKILMQINLPLKCTILLNELIKTWDTLAYYCLKLSLREEDKQLENLERYFKSVESIEKKFWNCIKENLERE